MRIECEFLGTGTSTGVPFIGCSCGVCTSDDPRNRRLRSSVLLRVDPGDGRERQFLIDCTPDFRQQALRAGVGHLDGLLLTHEHADHTMGMDDLRACYWRRRDLVRAGRLGPGQSEDIPLFCYPETLSSLHQRFDYLFDREYEYKGVARFDVSIFEERPFIVDGIEVTPVPLVHGNMRVAAFRIGDFAYITDTNRVPPTSLARLDGVKLLVIDALRHQPHPTHMSLPESIKVCRTLGVDRGYFTHITHDVDHGPVDRTLPKGLSLAYDTLRVSLETDGSIFEVGDRLPAVGSL